MPYFIWKNKKSKNDKRMIKNDKRMIIRGVI